jgi:hypothetical protein
MEEDTNERKYSIKRRRDDPQIFIAIRNVMNDVSLTIILEGGFAGCRFLSVSPVEHSCS